MSIKLINEQKNPARRRTPRPIASAFVATATLVAISAVPMPANAAAARTFSAISVTANGGGYGVVATSGENYDFGAVVSHGNPAGFNGNIVDVAVTADGKGYIEVSSAGQVYAYGTVAYRGNPSGFSGSIVGVSVTADGQGYADVSSAGQNYDYGTVVSRGNPTGFSGSIVGVSVTADGQGYADVSSTGQVYAYGTVTYRGNGDPGSATAATYAKEILGNSSISKTGRLVSTDLTDAANGKPATAGAPLSATMLGIIAEFGHTHTFTINALESGGTGHCNNTPKAKCPTDPHYNGDAVDFGTVNGVSNTGRNTPAITIINAIKYELPSGSGFGQKECGATPSLPPGITTFNDTCTHLHVQVPAHTS